MQTTISPYTQQAFCSRALSSPVEVSATISRSRDAYLSWKDTSIDERIEICTRWLGILKDTIPEVTTELALQMGRPVMYTGEIKGVIIRCKHLMSIAKTALSPQVVESSRVVLKEIVRQPVGVVVVISPWNYPFSCTVNILIAAILAGNSVIIKPSPQTPLPAERIARTLIEAGLPADVVQVVHADQDTTLKLLADRRINFVAFTGSVAGGQAIARAVATGKGFKGVTLELGGKDAAYVRGDADLGRTAKALVDASMFNSGQSCASVERIYVDNSVYKDFVTRFVELAKQFRLGDPLSARTSLGPVVSLASASRIRRQLSDAVAAGATLLLGDADFAEVKEGSTTLAPHVVVDVDHSMSIMKDETFGPVVGIMPVDGDEQALQLMNDSHYGLTASVWTSSKSRNIFEDLAQRLEAGTVYLNKADGMDGALPWGGVKDSGWGVSLSTLAFDQVTRAKSINQNRAL